jgi:hypothetical protein
MKDQCAKGGRAEKDGYFVPLTASLSCHLDWLFQDSCNVRNLNILIKLNPSLNGSSNTLREIYS